MGELRRAVQDQLAEPGVPLRHEAAALDRRHDLARGPEFPRDLHRRGLGCCFDRAIEAHFEIDVPFDSVVHQHAARFLGLEHVDDRRQFLILDDNLRRDVFGFGARVGDAHGDQFANVADLVDDERRLFRCLKSGEGRYRPDGADVGEVFGGKNRRPQVIGDANSR